jgi:cytochrome c
MKSAVILSALLFALSACGNKPPSYDAATGGNPQRGREAIVSYGCGACHTRSMEFRTPMDWSARACKT